MIVRLLILLLFLAGAFAVFRYVFLPLWEKADVLDKKRRLELEEELAKEITDEHVSPDSVDRNRRTIEQYKQL